MTKIQSYGEGQLSHCSDVLYALYLLVSDKNNAGLKLDTTLKTPVAVSQQTTDLQPLMSFIFHAKVGQRVPDYSEERTGEIVEDGYFFGLQILCLQEHFSKLPPSIYLLLTKGDRDET